MAATISTTYSPYFLQLTSTTFGWIYTLCWSLSFYPQPILNFRRQSTRGTTIDFPAINVLGFIAYFISNCAFLYSPQIRREYAARHHGLTPTVRFNDVVFAGHAVILATLTLSMFSRRVWGFDSGKGMGQGRGREKKVSKAVAGIIVGSCVGIVTVVVIVLARKDEDPATGWAWIDVMYALSFVKLLITIVKYMPQVLTNYRNRSTQGWSIAQILFDFVGGILSIAQLCIDSYLQGDWSGMSGNIVKLALGNVSVFFDVIFITQHYVLYRGSHESDGEGESDPLLVHREDRIE